MLTNLIEAAAHFAELRETLEHLESGEPATTIGLRHLDGERQMAEMRGKRYRGVKKAMQMLALVVLDSTVVRNRRPTSAPLEPGASSHSVVLGLTQCLLESSTG